MKAYPTWLEDKPIDFMADLGREAAFQKLKKQEKKKHRDTTSVKQKVINGTRSSFC